MLLLDNIIQKYKLHLSTNSDYFVQLHQLQAPWPEKFYCWICYKTEVIVLGPKNIKDSICNHVIMLDSFTKVPLLETAEWFLTKTFLLPLLFN